MKKKNKIWLLMVLVLSLLVAMPCYASDEDEQFEVCCVTDAHQKISDAIQHYWLTFEITNKGNDFEGVLQCMTYLEDSQSIAYGQHISIAEGETKEISVKVDNRIGYLESDAQIPVRLDFFDSDGQLTEQKMLSYQFSWNNIYGINSALLTDNQALEKLQNVTKIYYDYQYDGIEDYYTYDIHIEKVDDIEDDITKYHLIIIDRPVNEAEWHLIRQWVMQGGWLMISEKILPDSCFKDIAVGQVDPYGKGAVLACKEIKSDSDWFNDVVKNLISEYAIDASGYRFDQRSLFEGLSVDFQSRLPEFSKIMVILILYILLSSLGASIVLKKMDRRQYLWLIMPGIAVAISFFLYFACSATRMNVPVARYVSKIWLAEDGYYEETGIRIVVPKKEKVVKYFADERTITPLTDNYSNCYLSDEADNINETWLNQKEGIVLFNNEPQTELIIDNKSLFGQFDLSSEKLSDEKADYEDDLTVENDLLSGSLKNNTPWDIRHVFIADGYNFWKIGDIKSGETVTIDALKAQKTDEYYMLNDYENAEDYLISEEENSRLRIAMRKLIDDMLWKQLDHTIIIAGFTTDYGIPDLQQQFNEVNGIALVVKRTGGGVHD